MRYKNPILKAFHPDPSICRVGDEFYLATSSFSYFPGLPIYKSEDLINWAHVGNAITREEQLPLIEAAASGGIWAPTIRYQDGIFYITATFSEKGNFIVTSTDIEKGFGDPVWVEMDGIDPSLFFEDGKAFYCANDIGSRMKKYGTEGISVAEIDMVTGKLLEEPVRIWEGTHGGFLESPHIYHIGDYYYLMIAEGGTSLNHMITIARSRSIYGPFEGCPDNPILTNRSDTSKRVLCSGHGDLVEDLNGNWWMVHLATRPSFAFYSHLGRETFLMPVSWQDGWPVVGIDHKSHLEVEVNLPVVESKVETLAQNDREWLTLRVPNKENITITENKITLRALPIKLSDDIAAPAMVLTRQKDFEDELWTKMHFSPKQDGDYAGMVVYLSNQHYYRVGIKREGEEKYLIVERFAEDFFQIAYKKEMAGDEVTLGIKVEKTQYRFMFMENDKSCEMCTASTRFLCCEFAGKCFTGTMWGMFAESIKDSGVCAEFEVM